MLVDASYRVGYLVLLLMVIFFLDNSRTEQWLVLIKGMIYLPDDCVGGGFSLTFMELQVLILCVLKDLDFSEKLKRLRHDMN